MSIIKLAEGFLDEAPPSDKAPPKSPTNDKVVKPTEPTKPTETQLATTPQSSPTPAKPIQVSQSNPKVIEMQKSMKSFYDKITDLIVNASSRDNNLLISKTLNRFLAKQKLNISTIYDSIKSIGKIDRNGNIVPDGIWGDKTNQALINIKKLLPAIKDIANKTGIEINLNTMDALKKIQDSSSKINVSLAPEITAYLDNLTNELELVINNFNEKINSSKDEVANVGYRKSKEISKDDMSSAQTLTLRNVPGIKQSVSLTSLLDANQFKKLLTKLPIPGEDPYQTEFSNEQALKVLNDIESKIKSGEISIYRNDKMQEEFKDPWEGR